MTIEVDYLSPQAIEREANALLASFEAKHGKILSLGTPLDEIVEFHLGLTCEIDLLPNFSPDLSRVFHRL